jgi:hypothetical protein
VERNLGAELAKNKTVHLKADENSFSFEFSGLEFTNPDPMKYAYKLDGYDNDWIDATEMRYAAYTNLPGGQYTFNARYTIPGIDRQSIVQIPIYLETPFTKTIAFISGVVVLGIVILLIGFYLYVRTIRKQHNKEAAYNRRITELQMDALRTQISPHFIFNAMNSINQFIIKNDTFSAYNHVTKLAKLIRGVLENAGVRSIPLTEEISMLRMYIALELNRLEGCFDYSIEVDPAIDEDATLIPGMIIQPYVENAIWHGLSPKPDRGLLQVKFEPAGDTLKVTVQDNGVGRKNKPLNGDRPNKRSLGHQITDERLRILNKLYKERSSVHIFDLEDDKGEPAGTKVEILLYSGGVSS